jgi:hypothetical protein
VSKAISSVSSEDIYWWPDTKNFYVRGTDMVLTWSEWQAISSYIIAGKNALNHGLGKTEEEIGTETGLNTVYGRDLLRKIFEHKYAPQQPSNVNEGGKK